MLRSSLGPLQSILRRDESRPGSHHFVTILIGSLLCLGVYVSVQLILADDFHSFVYLGLVICLAVIFVAVLKDWKRGVYYFLAWITFEDLIRKYMGNNMLIFFAKDFLVLSLYISFIAARRSSRVKNLLKPSFRMPLLFFVWLGVLQVFNPASTSFFYGLLGLKLYFLYIPLLWIGYALLNDEREIRRLFFFSCVLILAVAAVGIAQSILGHSFLNPTYLQEDIREVSTLYRVSPTTGAIAYRPTSVFVSTGRFVNLLVISWVFALGFSGYLLMRKQSGRWLPIITVGAVAAAALMSTSRGVIVWLLVSLLAMGAAFLWGVSWTKEQHLQIMRAIRRSAVVVVIAISILVALFPDAVASRVDILSETLSPWSTKSEFALRAHEYPLDNFVRAFDFPRWPYGYGIGTASLGVQYVTRILHATPMKIGVENGYGQLVLELGIVGLLLWIILTWAVCRSAWKAANLLRGTRAFPLAFGLYWNAFLLLLPMSFYGLNAYQDFIVNAYLWLTLGCLFRMPELVRTQAAQALP